MRKHKNEEAKENNERWLLTYSDMMNNLLILFMVLYAMSVIDLTKFKALAKEMNKTFSYSVVTQGDGTSQSLGSGTGDAAGDTAGDESATGDESGSGTEAEGNDQFDEVYNALKTQIAEKGYGSTITLEKGNNYIKIRFGDNVLFYPDSPVIKSSEISVLQTIGDILSGINPLIRSIEIAGHTATTGQSTNSFFAWELSSERAIAVLKHFVQNCNLPESKMYISGFSKYQPVASNETEASRQLNRRVEIKITKVTDDIADITQ